MLQLRVNAFFLFVPLFLVAAFYYSSPLLEDATLQTTRKVEESPGGRGQQLHVKKPFSTFTDVQNAVTSVLQQRETELSVMYTGDTSRLKSDIDKMFLAIFENDNYLHYVTKSYTASYTYSPQKAYIQFSFTYWESKSESEFVDDRAAEIINSIIKFDMSDEQKEKTIHDWIANHFIFDETLQHHSAFAGLSPSTGYATVCQGYALLFYKLLQLAGIESRIVEGTAGNEDHIWNVVKLNGQWLHVDTTWDRVALGAGSARYTYFNLTGGQMALDHAISASSTPFN